MDNLDNKWKDVKEFVVNDANGNEVLRTYDENEAIEFAENMKDSGTPVFVEEL